VFKKANARIAFLLLLGVLIAPIGKTHAQSTSSAPQPDVITGGDPEPPGEPDVITGGDPEPPGEPDGIYLLWTLTVGTAVVAQLS
jgi:hypothetical protein